MSSILKAIICSFCSSGLRSGHASHALHDQFLRDCMTNFCAISPGHSWTCPMCPSSSQLFPSLSHSNPISSSFSVSPSSHTPNPPPPLTNTHKTISSKTNPSPKTTSNNPIYPPNHPQLIYTYPPSASSTPPPQTQYTTSPLTQSSFHPSSPSRKQPPNPTVEC